MNILLQVPQLYEQSLVSRLGDQLFCIVLLVGFAIYSLRRQKSIEDKLEKYMAEDREEMKDVIQNNTAVFKEVIAKLGRLSAVVFLVLLSSCRPYKSIHKVATTDTLKNLSAVSTNTVVSEKTETVQKDTIISVPTRIISGKLFADDLKPVFNSNGVAKPNKKEISGNGVKVLTTANPDGTIDVVASCDSLNILVRGLTTQNRELISYRDSVEHTDKYASHSRISDTKKTKTGISYWSLLLGAATGGVCVWLFNRFQISTLIRTIFSRAKH